MKEEVDQRGRGLPVIGSSVSPRCGKMPGVEGPVATMSYLMRLRKTELQRERGIDGEVKSVDESQKADSKISTREAPREELDRTVWRKHLPDEVVGIIMAWLPLSSFCRLRCVCKRWNSIVSDPCFKAASGRVPRQDPLQFMNVAEGYLTYDSATQDWKTIPYAYFFPRASRLGLAHDLKCEYRVAAAAGSVLLLRQSPVLDKRPLLVMNPINKSERVLPPILDTMPESVATSGIMGMVMDNTRAEQGAFKVLVVDRPNCCACQGESTPVTLQIFDSLTDRWEMSGTWLTDAGMNQKALAVALCQGNLFCLTGSSKLSYSRYSLRICDIVYCLYLIGPEFWDDIKVSMPRNLLLPHLFENRGRLLMVGGLNMAGYLKGICIWELDFVKLRWMKVRTIADHLVKKVSRIRVDDLFFISNGDYLCFGFAQKGSKVIVFNIVTGAWRVLPALPRIMSVNVDRPWSKFDTFLFEPRLEVLI